MSTKAHRQARRVPCGCTMLGKRTGVPCRRFGSLQRVTLAQIDFVSKEKYRLVCAYHATLLRRYGAIVHAEDALL